jgi:Cu/Ag efflux pump CusA
MGRETGKVMKEYRRETVNHETGEVEVTENIQERVVSKEPSFVKLYLRDVMFLQDLSPSLNTVMYQLLSAMDYENMVVVNVGMKRIIAERVGLSFSSVNNAITAFVKGHLLERRETGVYRVNPYLFAKGDWKSIQKIRLEVIYSLEGKSLRTILNDDVEEVQSDSEG